MNCNKIIKIYRLKVHFLSKYNLLGIGILEDLLCLFYLYESINSLEC